MKGKFRNPYSRRFLKITNRMVKEASRKYGVPEECIQINLVDHMAQKHGFVGLETYRDVEKLIDDIAKELSK